MEIVRKIDARLGTIVKWATAIVLFVQVLVIFLGVFFRYFLRSPLTWVDELSCYLLVFTTFMGGYVAFKEAKLARITIIVDRCPPLLKKALVILADLAILAFLIAVAYYGSKLAGMPTIQRQKTPAMQIPMIYFFAFIPISGVLMAINSIVRTYDAFRGVGIDEHGEQEVVT